MIISNNKISTYFTWKEATYLHKWGRVASDQELTEDVQRNLVALFYTIDKVRELLNKPIIVQCAFRPTEYNKLVKGAPKSQHLKGCAVDFIVVGLSCDEVKEILKPKLAELKLRMEDNGLGATWIHLDTLDVPDNFRFFKP